MKLFILVLSSFLAIAASAQNTSKLTGTWEGKIYAGVQIRVVFHFKDSLGNITGSTDSPDQGVKGIPCSHIILRNDSLLLDVTTLRANYAGKFKNDSTITGQLIQGVSINLTLSKVVKVSALLRPQTPQPPFPYISEDVEYDNAGKTLHYGATITLPQGKGPFAAVRLITGSGAQNRDEEVFEHRPFAVIADHLTRQGFVVLRVDDRGTGKSSGDFMGATTADFATDVNTSLHYLKSRKEVDAKRLGMLGHSEGGMIAPMIASQRNDIDFIILLAAPGKKIPVLLEEQNVALLKSSGFSKEAAEDYGKLYRNMIPGIIKAKSTEEATTNLNNVVNEWKKNTPKDIVTATTGISNEITQQQFINKFSASLTSQWFKYFLQFDPEPYLIKLHCKVLALNGDKDLQVSETNLDGINNALKKSKSPAFDVKEMPGLNHLFQHCKNAQ